MQCFAGGGVKMREKLWSLNASCVDAMTNDLQSGPCRRLFY